MSETIREPVRETRNQASSASFGATSSAPDVEAPRIAGAWRAPAAGPASPPSGPAWDTPLSSAPLVFLDLETTGTDPETARICEIAAIRQGPGGDERVLVSLVRPSVPVGDSRRIHGISDEDLMTAPPMEALAAPLAEMLEGAVVVGHRIDFDLAFLRAAAARGEVAAPPEHALDTCLLAQRAWLRGSYGLAALAEREAICAPAHRAEPDARSAGALLGVLARALRAQTPRQLWQAQRKDKPIRMRDDVERALRAAMEGRRTVRIAYRVRGRAPFEDELEIFSLVPPRVEGWLRNRRVVRVLRGDRLLWAEPLDTTYQVPEGFVSCCPPGPAPGDVVAQDALPSGPTGEPVPR